MTDNQPREAESVAEQDASLDSDDYLEETIAESTAESAASGVSTPSDSQAVMKSSAIMAVGTITSRFTGVVRDIAVAAAIGSAIVADTYYLGNSLPNIIYILVIGGALNAIFIPQLIRHAKHDADGGDGYAHRLITLVGLILLVLAVLAIVFAPLIVDLYATSDFSAQEREVAIAFTRYCMPQVIFYGLYTMFSQVLNARMHFAAPMFAPIINNLIVIGTAIAFIMMMVGTVTVDNITPQQIMLLGLGTTIGVIAQAAILVPFMVKRGYRYRPKFNFRGYGLRKSGTLAGWTIGLVLVNQIGFLVIARLATHANVIAEANGHFSQGLATYQRAFLVFMLPHSVITISLVTALLPRMSQAAADGRLDEVADKVAGGMRVIAALIAPCAAVIGFFGPALGTIFFGFGANAGEPAAYTGIVVSMFAIGLIPFSLFYTLLRGWYSVEDTRTPFFVTVGYNVVAIPLTIYLASLAPDNYKVAALALAYSLAYWVALAFTWALLRRRLGSLDSKRTLSTLVRTMIAAIAAAALGVTSAIGVVGTATGDSFSVNVLSQSWWTAFATLAVGGLVTLAAYLLFSWVLRVHEVKEGLGVVTKRLKRSRG